MGLSLENVALRGTKLKNTDYVYGCAVYTGHDTKMSMNSKITSNKFSTVEKSMNRYRSTCTCRRTTSCAKKNHCGC